MRFESVKCPSDELSLTNCVFLNSLDIDKKHVAIQTSSGKFFFLAMHVSSIPVGKIGFTMQQRKWANISIGESVDLEIIKLNSNSSYISSITLEVDFVIKKSGNTEPYNTDEMAPEFCMSFPNMPVTVGQSFIFKFNDKKLLLVIVKELETLQVNNKGETSSLKSSLGVLTGNSMPAFEKSAESSVVLVGKCKAKGQQHQSIISPTWNFNDMGIGGLDREFADIFRRTFSSRVFPPEVVDQLGLKHVRGILLYGPPGTGKTLMARQIGKMLNAREPKIVNGPSILDKYVGESEANIRKLFAEAEEEESRMGINSALHIIIFDEIDAICKARGSMASSTAVHDTVVNQLLSKIDGVDQLNNILVIGMTNRRDMIDEALLRPGRLEVQMEINLPDEHGRLQIINIHTARMRSAGKLSSDVDLVELSKMTKNFSGAEIEGLCRASAFTAMNRLIKASDKVSVDHDAFDKLSILWDDFMHALEFDIKPAFGTQDEELDKYISAGIIMWGESVNRVLETGALAVDAARACDEIHTQPIAVLLQGPRNSGKTALAVQIAKLSQFPFVKLCTSKNMIGFSEAAKCASIKKIFDDAYKSTLSVIILDNIEGLIDYSPVGPRYSNYVTQALKDLVTNPLVGNKRLLILGTTSCRLALEELGIAQCFTASRCHVSNLSSSNDLVRAMKEIDRFDANEIDYIGRSIGSRRLCIGIKQLLDVVRMLSKVDASRRAKDFLSRLEDEGCLDDDFNNIDEN